MPTAAPESLTLPGLCLIEVINKHHYKIDPYPDPDHTFDIQRGHSPLGNPYVVSKSKTPKPGEYDRNTACDLYNQDLKAQIRSRGTDPECKVPGTAFFELMKLTKLVRSGKKIYLACTCKHQTKHVRCHGDEVVKAINWLKEEPNWQKFCAQFESFLDENASPLAKFLDSDWTDTPDTPAATSTEVIAPVPITRRENQVDPEQVKLNDLVQWVECPNGLWQVAISRVIGISPDRAFLKLSYIHNLVPVEHCDRVAEDHPKAKFWAMYKPVTENQYP